VIATFEALLDKVVVIPGLLYNVKQLTATTDLDVIKKTADMAISLMHNLLDWRSQWDTQHPLGSESIYEVDHTSFQINHHTDETGPLFNTFLSYQSLSVARTILVYDTAMLRLIHLVESLLLFDLSPKFTFEWERLSFEMQPRTFTDEVCRTIPFLIQPAMAKPGNITTLLMILLFAGRTTYVMVDGLDSREGRFLERVVQFVTRVTGSTICSPVIDKNLDSF